MVQKTYTAAGITIQSKSGGMQAGIKLDDMEAGVRYTNDYAVRLRQCVSYRLPRVDFVELPEPMSRIQALEFLLQHPNFQESADQVLIQSTLDELLEKYNKRNRISDVPKRKYTRRGTVVELPNKMPQMEKFMESKDELNGWQQLNSMIQEIAGYVPETTGDEYAVCIDFFRYNRGAVNAVAKWIAEQPEFAEVLDQWRPKVETEPEIVPVKPTDETGNSDPE